MLKAQNVGYSVTNKVLVQPATVEFEDGSLTAILGPNGAGKTKLVKLLSGEKKPTHGSVRLDGRPLSELSAQELAARRAVVPQAANLSFSFSVADVVMLGRTVPGLSGYDERADRICSNVLERADIAHLADRSYMQLSGGEKQRVHLARALAQLADWQRNQGASVLFLDEPTAALDLAHQLSILTEVRKEADAGLTVIAVLHDLNLAARFADQLILMCDGHLVAHGTPGSVIEQDCLSRVFDCDVPVRRTPPEKMPFILPQVCEAVLRETPAKLEILGFSSRTPEPVSTSSTKRTPADRDRDTMAGRVCLTCFGSGSHCDGSSSLCCPDCCGRGHVPLEPRSLIQQA
ncbi:MAG: heme ABC transporter ATP-binding protein [Pseudomonadota bacterium]